MGLKNDQYHELMRVYDRRQLENARELKERTDALYRQYPRLREIHDDLCANAAARARAKISGNAAAFSELDLKADDLKDEQARIYRAAGLSEADLLPRYRCPDCQDTGFIGGEKCHCFLQAAIDLLYTRSNIRDILSRENFDTLSMAYYSKEAPDGKRSVYDDMTEKIRRCRKFVEDFDRLGQSLLFFGPTGVGKTFLSNCIAKALIETCHSVVYFSAIDLFDMFSKEAYSYDEDIREQTDQYVLDSDLLIIDDLGTERINAFTTGKLFYCINERLNSRKSTIISTNLDPKSIADIYTERIASRILSNYECIPLNGDDIRIMKKFRRGGQNG